MFFDPNESHVRLFSPIMYFWNIGLTKKFVRLVNILFNKVLGKNKKRVLFLLKIEWTFWQTWYYIEKKLKCVMLIIGMPYFLIDLKIKYLIFKKYFQDLFSNDQRWSFRAGIMPLSFFFNSIWLFVVQSLKKYIKCPWYKMFCPIWGKEYSLCFTVLLKIHL